MTVFHFSKKVFLLAGAFALLTLTGCKDENTKKDTLKTENTTTDKNAVENAGDIAVNPPHGEPGHRCEIPVGAPLNAPAKTEENTIKTQTSSEKSPFSINSNTTTNSSTSGKVNPAHGEPGHRCDIPVGAPLD